MSCKLKEMDLSKLSDEMIRAAKSLNTGNIMVAYTDNGRIRMETENGKHTYVWRDGKWRIMPSYF